MICALDRLSLRSLRQIGSKSETPLRVLDDTTKTSPPLERLIGGIFRFNPSEILIQVILHVLSLSLSRSSRRSESSIWNGERGKVSAQIGHLYNWHQPMGCHWKKMRGWCWIIKKESVRETTEKERERERETRFKSL